jgi:hypothetical protein
VDALLNLLAAMKVDKTAQVTDTVQTLLGRKAGTFQDWARRHAAAFK